MFGNLGHDIIGDIRISKNSAFIMHGIFGNRRNMRGLGNLLIEQHKTMSCFSLDHRGHGSSNISGNSNTIDNCAVDVFNFEHHIGVNPSIVVGHSFGGKVALKYAELLPAYASSSKLKSVIILDTFPGLMPEETLNAKHQPIKQVLTSLLSVKSTYPDGFTSHKDFCNKLQSAALGIGYKMPDSISSWLATNLSWIELNPDGRQGKYIQTLDLDVIHELIVSHWNTDMIPFLIEFAMRKESLFDVSIITAEFNQLWKEDHKSYKQLLQIVHDTKDCPLKMIEMKGVGHWLHHEKPRELIQLISSQCFDKLTEK